jgi:hypothetical protein
MLIQNIARTALFFHVSAKSNTTGFHDVNRPAPAIFRIRIDHIKILEQL